MSSLTTALAIAQSALRTTGKQTSIVSRNISEAQNPDYTRRIAAVSSTAPGARSISVQRAVDALLFKNNLNAQSAFQAQQTLYDGMERLGLAVNGVENVSSAATMLGKLQEALQTYSSAPSNRNLGQNAVEAARDLVRSLNDGTNAIQSFRGDMDSQIGIAVNQLNDLLGQFKDANTEIVKGTHSGSDVSDALDRRDALLKQISSLVSVSTFTRTDNDMVIMTADGATLFETVPRSVTFNPNAIYSATTSGNAVYVDGVPLAAGAGGNTNAGGKIAGLLQLRDEVGGTMQSQLDEIARGLITAFAETDPSGTLAPQAGLFTWSGGPAIPASGTLVSGLAGTISLNAAFDSAAGGDPSLLRDGGANGVAYKHNTTGAASYSDLLFSYSKNLDAPMAFDPAASNGTTLSLSSFSTNAISWFEGMRSNASTAADAKAALATQTAESLSNLTGVNVDTEMSMLLDLENAYEASARIIQTINDMLRALLDAVR
ncbi:flagellar hook-associated protein FlgK [Mesorhizobium sp. BAC0120]|uniref:flagellar hook-associated protein FlgK n=1 Tax=Mesorhizobium sp. BAC0120 TaxID=3090670 RepID=UPI00298CE43A|nr:flagellar hook-associated protein FlgK [Mesorhizobium sp. BAC0120]MDW6024426.1 flagellar hook-associated protein FlgK [Mesorhizobium sp. BAC0120]